MTSDFGLTATVPAFPPPMLDLDTPAGRPTPAQLERAVIAIWQRALGIEPIAAEDDFFELGGNSIIATRLALMFSDQFGVDTDISVIFDHSTPVDLAQALWDRGANSAPDTAGP